jgi:TolA-binding protein
VEDSAETRSAGRLVYFEGPVGVQSEGDWAPARIDQMLRPSDRIGTGPGGKAEIKWPEGGRAVLGPADTQRVAHLRARAETEDPAEAGSLLERFRELFAEQGEGTEDPAAIRRGGGPPFEQATALYRDGRYREALPLFQKALTASSSGQAEALDSSRVALARFALAHCHLAGGEAEVAKSILQSLVERHPKSRPAALARRLLDTL